MKKKLGLGIKVAIAFGSVATVSGSIVGFMKLYGSQNKIGAQTIQIQNYIDTKIPAKEVQEAYFVDGFKNKIAKYDHLAKQGDKTNVELLVNLGSLLKGENLSFEDFIDLYLQHNNNSMPNLRLKVGPFEFVNNYLESMSPDEFIDFTNWYFKNVSWGPDLLTLKEFRLTRGVKNSSGTITLGAHSGTREQNEIEFYPDSFFGSIAMYDGTVGAGNSYNSLLRYYNEVGMEKDELDEYINNLHKSISYFNANHFKGLKFSEALVNAKNIYYFDATSFIISDVNSNFKSYKEIKEHNSDVKLNFVFEAKDKTQAKQKAFAYLQELATTYLFDINSDIVDVNSIADELVKQININAINKQEEKSSLVFSVTDESNQNFDFEYTIFESEFISKKSTNKVVVENINSIRANAIRQAISNNFERLFQNSLHWRSTYFINDHLLNKEIYVYDVNNNLVNPRFYATKILASEAETFNFDHSKLTKETIVKINVNENNDLELTTASNKKILLQEIKNNKPGFKYNASFDDAQNTLRVAIDFFDVYTPKIIKQSSKYVNGKIVNIYQVYYEIYSGLLDKITNKRPFLTKKIKGLHIESKVDQNGVMQYSLVDGEYDGFYETDRIPFISLVAESDPSFKTTGNNYLKYVSAHEYGHHQTLQYINDISEQEKSTVLGGLDAKSGVRSGSYYNIDVLQNYLDARSSGISARKVDVNYQPSNKGSLVNFSYNNDKNNLVWETIETIFGSANDAALNEFANHSDRRFLQKYNELIEAAKLRGVRLSDLFLLNSIDSESGTTNPVINSDDLIEKQKLDASYFLDVNLKQFVRPNDLEGLKAYEGIIKDGLNKPILFNQEGEPIVYRSKKADNSFTKANDIEILINKKDGSYVIDLNSYFDDLEDEVNFENNFVKFKEAVNLIVRGITSLFENSFSTNSGWNENDDDYTKEASFRIRSLNSDGAIGQKSAVLRNLLFKVYLNNLDLAITNDLVDLTNGNFYNNLIHNLSVFDYKNSDHAHSILLDRKNLNKDEKEILKYYEKFSQKVSSDFSRGILRHTLLGSSLLAKGIKDSQGNNYYRKPIFEELPVSTPKIFKKFDSISDLFSAFSEKNLQNTYNKQGGFLQPVSSLKVDDNPNELPRINLIIPRPNEQEASDFELYKQKLNAQNTKLVLFFSKSELDPYIDFLKKKTDDFEIVGPVSLGGNQYYYVELNNSDALLNWISVDPTKYKPTKIRSLIGEETDARKWDKEYLSYFFDLQKIKEAYGLFYDNLDDETFENSVLPSVFQVNLFMNEKFKYLIKSPTFKLSEIDNYKYWYDGKLGFTGTGWFGNKFLERDWDIPLGGQALDDWSKRFNQWNKLNPKNTTQPMKDNKEQISVDKIISIIKKRIQKDAKTNKDLEIDFGTLMLYSVGHTLLLLDKDNVEGAPITWTALVDMDSPSELEDKVSKAYLDANLKRSTEDLSGVFSDYLYSIAEVLTRDYVQTTYIPSTKTLDNLPDYLSGISEANSGNEYVFAGTNTKHWFNKLAPIFKGASFNELPNNYELINVLRNRDLVEQLITQRNNQAWLKLQKLKNENNDSNNDKPSNPNDFESIINSRPSNNKKDLFEGLETIAKLEEKASESKTKVLRWLGNYTDNTFEVETLNALSYIGNTTKLNNGFFKDRWLRTVIDWEIYDDQKNSIKDDKISILELDNKTKVTDRARALWIYSLRSQGVGDRTLSGIYRNKQTDSTLFWGFVKNENAKDVKYLVIEDEKTKQKNYLEVYQENSNNLFYFKKQADDSADSKVTLKDEGYTSWNTNYAILSNFSNSLVNFDASSRKGSEFRIYFANENKQEIFVKDENNNDVSLFNLGSRNIISENGKENNVSPISVFKKEDNKTYIRISNQFSI